ncbi:MAG TPA: hypothetical protein VI456_10415, partial [Polyangia bacterium]
MATGRWTGARAALLAIAALEICAPLAAGCGGGSLGKTPDGGGARDMRVAGTGGTAATGGAPGGTGGRQDAAVDVPRDSRPTGTLPVGHICTAAGDCATGFCADGFCCATDCSG